MAGKRKFFVPVKNTNIEKRETEENLPSINQPSTSKRQLFTSSSESLPLQSFNFQEKSLPTISQTSKKHLEDLKSGVVCDVNEEKSEKSSACPDIIKEGFDAKNNPTEVEVEMSPDKNVGANNDNAAVAEFAEENEERGLVEPEPVGNGVVRDGIESESSGEEAVSDEDPIELLQRRELELKTPANSDEEDDSLNSIKKQKRPLLKRFTKKKQKPAAQRSLNPTFEGMDGPNQREIPKERKEENMTKEVPSVVQSSSFEAEQVKKSAFDEPSKFNRDPGTWVQCTNSYCEKWRFLKKFRDPSLIPEVWTCSMNSDVTYNDCSIPEESWSKEEEVSSVYTAYVPGSLVWAKVRGYPWWPGMVVQDPEIDKFFQLDGFSELPVEYFVIFFDSGSLTSAWVATKDLKTYSAPDYTKVSLLPIFFFHS
ncbi:zinc finger CW-type PWWP domain protein 1-like [Artemia franciscana]|uniref:zinc finger CW-type PWWP domain protein 1-like n=1 Tax=Artemia franciscana TaxID=6661 RepID=UPI0032DAE97D